MNLGFDLDKIFIDYPPFIPSRLIDRIYKKKSNSESLLYRIPSKPEQFLRLCTHHPLLRPPIKQNIEFIIRLRQQLNHHHFLISSRFSFLKKTTELLIKKYKLNQFFDNMFFNFEDKQPHIFKNEVIQKFKIHRYVDDDLPLLHFVSKQNPKTLLFWFNKKEKKSLKKNLIAITHLSEMLQ